jgi:hypothetical protein
MKYESKFLKVITVVTASLVISACSSSPSTECGGAESIDLVKQIAKTNAVYEKDFLDFETEEMNRVNLIRKKLGEECHSLYRSQWCYSIYGLREHLEKYGNSATAEQHGTYQFWKEKIQPIDLEIENVKSAYKKLVPGNIIYEVSDIITTGKNKELNSASCKATLSGKIDGIASTKSNITFKLETTSDKKLSATVNF